MKKGFTLIELIVYIGLVSIFITGVILFAWDIVFGGAKSNVQRVVNSNLRLVAKRISYEIKNSSGINYIATDDLCLSSATSTRNPTRVYLSSGRLKISWGGGTANCTSMTNDQFLSDNLVSVSGLNFTNRSVGGNSRNIEYSFTVSANGARQEWQKSQNYSSTAEIRSH